MKPLLPAAHITETEEDQLIWSLVFNFAPHEDIWDRLTVRSIEADRRDAELMLGIQRLRADGWYQPLSAYFREGRENIERALGGWLP